ncbi:MAG: heme-binding domain-containing protein [Pseudomonadota bacterium]
MNETWRRSILLFSLYTTLFYLVGCGKAKYSPVVKPVTLGSDDGLKSTIPRNENEVEAARYFKEDLTPALNIDCSGCHRDGGIGPSSIFNFEAATKLAKAGTLLSKPNGDSHGGGKVCKGGSPCTEIQYFLRLIAPVPPPASTQTPTLAHTPPHTPTPTPTPMPTATANPTSSSMLGLKVKTYFDLNCMGCHSSTSPKLNNFEALRLGSGSSSEKYINVDDPESSLLIQVLSTKIRRERKSTVSAMPPGGPDAANEDLQLLKEWIKIGAPDPSATITSSEQLEDLKVVLARVSEQYTQKIEPILSKKCFACHSSTYDINPLYRDWPIVKDVIDKHVGEGRLALDFAYSFPFKKNESVGVNVSILKNMAADVAGKQMPPRYFTALPWYKDLRWEEREAIVDWSFHSALLLTPFLAMDLKEVK